MTKTYKIFPGKKRPQYVQLYKDNRNTIRSYVRRGGVILGTLKAEPFSERWQREYHAIMAGQPLPANDEDAPLEPGRVRPFSFGALVAEYLRRQQGFGDKEPWCALKPKTQKNYRRHLDDVVATYGDVRVDAMLREQIEEWLGQKSDARNLWTVLKILFALAQHLKWRQDNLMAGMGRAKQSKDGFHTWSELELARYAKHHADNPDAMWVLWGMTYGCGARSGDFCTLGWENIYTDEDGDRWLKFRPSKTDQSTEVDVDLPIKDERFLAVLATRPADGFFLPSREGGHWTEAHLRKEFRGWCREANIPDKAKMHGLRKAFACWMMNNGCGEGQIAAALGDTVESIRPYIAKYDRRKAGAAGIQKAARKAA